MLTSGSLTPGIGDTLMHPHPTPLELLAQFPRFWSKVSIGAPNECWLWEGGQQGEGYGSFKFDGQSQLAHRLAYKLLVGPVPGDMEFDHLCRVRRCVNPTHLEVVTHLENVRRGLGGRNQAQKTHCPTGHAYDLLNTYRYRGSRHCRACMRKRTSQWAKRTKRWLRR